MGIIYKATFPNGKNYIGKTTVSLDKRIGQHIGSKTDILFHKALRKYGSDCVNWEILYETSNDDLNRLEVLSISRYNTLVPNGYNLKTGGNGGNHSETTKRKIGKASQGRNTGRKHTPEALENMRAAGLKRRKPRPLPKPKRLPRPKKERPHYYHMINETKRNQILAELIGNPLESDTAIAERCVVSRGVVKKIRLEKGLWTERRVREVNGKSHVYRVPKPKSLSESQRLSSDEMMLSTGFLKQLIKLKLNPNGKECWDLINDVLKVAENSL